ncbi:hypothetical protein PENTCL1PPCAC_15386 [Pristionchus entomophagus]|uniref:Tc1-like transposase DDE domain-containing protein n=1 Tax=Pristionchus entomophagus TaxID=358040 RepID=A0AAV5TCC3_9BILA|nr:hypothetical protein PENTCL1PPCAC_15386 [Pristionchus entomophagus]
MNEYLCRLQSNYLRCGIIYRKMAEILCWSTDETWVHKGMRPKIGWQDIDATKNPLTFIRNGLTAGNSAQWERGDRLVIVACLSEDGFRCPLIWLTGKKDDGGDYHKEMNSGEFERYIEGVIKALVAEAKEKKLKPVLLMDNAKYHSRFVIDFSSLINQWSYEMIPLLKKFNRNDYNVYVVDTMAEEYGVTLVRTPYDGICTH